jgi:hypothetical protein
MGIDHCIGSNVRLSAPSRESSRSETAAICHGPSTTAPRSFCSPMRTAHLLVQLHNNIGWRRYSRRKQDAEYTTRGLNQLSGHCATKPHVNGTC